MCGSSAAKSYGSGGSVWAIGVSVKVECCPRAMITPRLPPAESGRVHRPRALGGRHDCGALPPLAQPAQNTGEDGDVDDHEDHHLDVLLDPRHQPPEEVAGEEHAPDPG